MGALLALGLIACGSGSGGGDSEESPQKVLDETFQSGKDYSKGVADLSFKLTTEGGQSGGLEAAVKGPYQGEKGAFPQFGLSVDAKVEGSGQSVGVQGRLTSTAGAAYLNFQGTDYQVDEPTFKEIERLFLSAQSQAGDARSGGLDPASLLTDLSNEGNEDIDGTDTIHISGKADVGKLAEELKNAPAAADAPGAAQLDQLKSSVKSADFDVFTGADDKRLRKIDGNIVFAPPADQTGGSAQTITIEFSLGLTDLGQAQTISAPADAQPLSALLAKFGIDPNALGSALGAAAGSASGSSPGATSGAAPAPPSNGETSKYLQCLSQAKGQAATEACSELLQ